MFLDELDKHNRTFPLAERMLTGLAWCEGFVLLGIHCFWVLTKSWPLGVDNGWGALFALFPFAVMIALGAGAHWARIQVILLRLEAAFHCSASLTFFCLILYVMLHDPFSLMVPLAYPMLLWSVGLSFLLAANLSLHLRLRSTGGAVGSMLPIWLTLLLAVVWWGVTLGLAANGTWAVYFWTASIALHALLAVISVRKTNTDQVSDPSDEPFAGRLLPVSDGFLLLGFIFVAQMLAAYASPYMGTAESKYVMYFDSYRSFAFFAGAGLFLAAHRYRFTPLTHAAIAAILLFSTRGIAWACGGRTGLQHPRRLLRHPPSGEFSATPFLVG